MERVGGPEVPTSVDTVGNGVDLAFFGPMSSSSESLSSELNSAVPRLNGDGEERDGGCCDGFQSA